MWEVGGVPGNIAWPAAGTAEFLFGAALVSEVRDTGLAAPEPLKMEEGAFRPSTSPVLAAIAATATPAAVTGAACALRLLLLLPLRLLLSWPVSGVLGNIICSCLCEV
eukprot:CAMPEP_0174385416 /NCGR_PEP_ID=MMETSP0811_2-20130205/126584_1 /TAXON_ID=73025 ORGANISM="Eutreptiella gymnastica-like, Strain CCMP1594" /NCGR_SAMPLE_ID=MMETSP0811_2 /ASSEMBLY_ACC=CAM_ASM_000667 /LENGTH=107 /DNA_ID=CAMNT_0015539723 /DNA_START=49 /DNA_END=372 /DNA_ORIENTATION=+